jgi:hypothetical protein
MTRMTRIKNCRSDAEPQKRGREGPARVQWFGVAAAIHP